MTAEDIDGDVTVCDTKMLNRFFAARTSLFGGATPGPVMPLRSSRIHLARERHGKVPGLARGPCRVAMITRSRLVWPGGGDADAV